jgi:hypothetical protein
MQLDEDVCQQCEKPGTILGGSEAEFNACRGQPALWKEFATEESAPELLLCGVPGCTILLHEGCIPAHACIGSYPEQYLKFMCG